MRWRPPRTPLGEPTTLPQAPSLVSSLYPLIFFQRYTTGGGGGWLSSYSCTVGTGPPIG